MIIEVTRNQAEQWFCVRFCHAFHLQYVKLEGSSCHFVETSCIPQLLFHILEFSEIGSTYTENGIFKNITHIAQTSKTVACKTMPVYECGNTVQPLTAIAWVEKKLSAVPTNQRPCQQLRFLQALTPRTDWLKIVSCFSRPPIAPIMGWQFLQGRRDHWHIRGRWRCEGVPNKLQDGSCTC